MKYDWTVVSGGFDPLHVGHMRLLHHASELSKFGVLVLVNSDDWLIRKKGFVCFPQKDRVDMLSNVRHVADVKVADDDDDTVVIDLRRIRKRLGGTIAFCNGGDRGVTNTPEQQVSGISFEFGVGGFEKSESSSRLQPSRRIEKSWGYYIDHYRSKNVVLKTLVIEPRQKTSLQFHHQRSEAWYVASGSGILRGLYEKELRTGDIMAIEKTQIHQIINAGDRPLVIYEMQAGDDCRENDIVRL